MDTKDIDRLIGRRVRQERKRRGLTLEELSELCSMSVSYLGYVERGQKASSLTVLKKLSIGLRVPLYSLLSTITEKALAKDDPWSDLLKLAPLLKSQKPEDRKRIVRYLKDSFRRSKTFFSLLK